MGLNGLPQYFLEAEWPSVLRCLKMTRSKIRDNTLSCIFTIQLVHYSQQQSDLNLEKLLFQMMHIKFCFTGTQREWQHSSFLDYKLLSADVSWYTVQCSEYISIKCRGNLDKIMFYGAYLNPRYQLGLYRSGSSSRYNPWYNVHTGSRILSSRRPHVTTAN